MGKVSIEKSVARRSVFSTISNNIARSTWMFVHLNNEYITNYHCSIKMVMTNFSVMSSMQVDVKRLVMVLFFLSERRHIPHTIIKLYAPPM